MKRNSVRLLAPLLLGVAGLVLAPAAGRAEASLSGQAGPPDHELVLWYRAPATNWMTSALPIGNGRLGGMVFGGVAQEHVQFNEKTLWTGDDKNYGSYQSFGDVYLDFPGLSSASGYRRELDIEEAIARVTYSADSVQYTREYFVSHPDEVMVLRLSSSAAGKVSVDVRVTDAHRATPTISANVFTLSGKLDLVSYEAQLQIAQEGGSISTGSDRISVRNADAVTILLAAGTDFDASQPTYRGTPPHATVGAQLSAAAQKSYGALRSAHLADYQALFKRVLLDLGEVKPSIPTPEVISSYNGGIRDPFLEVLYFQFGRYLTLSSSRGLGLPSNLQGIWNDSNNPPWASDIHNNINVQENYWPTDPTNLAECFTPYSDWLYTEGVVRETWKANAASKGLDGFTFATQNNIFGFSNWEDNPEASAWFGHALWDHFRFTQDTGFLKNAAYPFMKGACDYWLSALVTDRDGKLVAPSSFSPEHGNPLREDGTTYAQTLIFQLFRDTIEAGEILGVDAAYLSTLQTKLDQLDPGLRLGANVVANGKSYGPLLREWKYQNDQLGEQHRHLSHLVGLYPGELISPLIDTTWSDAARASLIDRGDGGTGWSRAWKIATWARLLDGNHAKTLLESALHGTDVTFVDMSGSTGGIYENLLDAHPPFQIDGNFGATAGVAEMLLQSHLDRVHILPALPGAWAKGSVKGLVARGAFTVDIDWEGGVGKDTTIASRAGNACAVKNRFFTGAGGVVVVGLSDGCPVQFTSSGDTITFATRAGEKYRIASPAAIAASGITCRKGGGSSGASGSSGGGSSSGGSGAGSSGTSSGGSSGGGASSGSSSGGGSSGSSGGSASSGGSGSPGTSGTPSRATGGCASGGVTATALPFLLWAALLGRRRRAGAP